jgi:hypothetical protein|eukprot:COSAG01_NODE_10951_length_2040_cov_1.697579_1_plen_36_part_00
MSRLFFQDIEDGNATGQASALEARVQVLSRSLGHF